ncbi:MAG: lactate utilization protein [Acidobacteriia bacterium]|nr:lactate utilization protein [Terriglobia bacterium]
MSNRDNMLARVRKALGRSPESPRPAWKPRADWPDLGPVLPPIPPGEEVPKFEEELSKVAGTPHRAKSAAALEEILAEIVSAAQAKSLVLSRNPLLKALGLPDKLRARGLDVDIWPEGDAFPNPAYRERCFAAEVGITGVDFVLAESGTLVLTSGTEGAQLASLAPPVHVALYRQAQALASLEELLERLPVPRDPDEPLPGRSVVLVTGPSRTADIEQILIRGVHGPREVHAILVEDSCLA